MSQHERTHWLLLFLTETPGSFSRGSSEENGILCLSVSASVSGLASTGLWFGPTVALRLLANWVRMCALGIQDSGALFVSGVSMFLSLCEVGCLRLALWDVR